MGRHRCYTRLLGLENWKISANNLAVFASLIAIAMALGLVLAILIDQKIRAEAVLRSIFLYPMALSFIVTGTAWKWLLDPAWAWKIHAPAGLAGFCVRLDQDGDMAIYCVVIAAVWQTSGFAMALFLAGLRGWTPSRSMRRGSMARAPGRSTGASSCRNWGRFSYRPS